MRMQNRRQFVAGALALPAAWRAMAEGSPVRVAEVSDPKWVLLGTDKGQGIYRASWNAATGELGKPELAIATERPTYFALHPQFRQKPVLYAANERNSGDGRVSSFHVEPKTGALQAWEMQSAHGTGTCYLSTDQTGKYLFAANYGGGNLTVFELQQGGLLTDEKAEFDCQKNPACGLPGPQKDRQDGPHLHCAVVAPDNKYVLVCNLGEDAIEVFPIQTSELPDRMLGEPERVMARSGSGPRHLAFHPNGKWVYCIHELDCTIDVYSWERGKMTLLGGSVISTLKSEADRPGSTGCEIVVGKSGKFVYANTRGENSLTVYQVNGKTGLLTEQQRVDIGGTVTRLIAFDPTEQWLVCCNQGSDTVTVFAHDAKTGSLGVKPKTFAADSPMCVAWV